jgi:hypothetical protein
MIGVLRVASLVLAFATLFFAAPAYAGVPVLVAAGRCNSQTIDDASVHLRDYDRRGTSGSPTQVVQRYAAIADVLKTLNEERDILDSVCADDSRRAALFAQIAAFSAWALALEADVAAKLNATCPAAAKAFPTMMLADAWLSLGRVVNDQNGAVPRAFSDVVPKVETRAQAVGLTLPKWADTSAYWRDQVQAQAKAQIATCPSPK